MVGIPDDWLERVNRKMGEEGVPYIRRPYEAISRWTIETGSDFIMPSVEFVAVTKWFEDHSPAGSHAIGSMFTGAFYYDAHFWKVIIPVAYGTVQIRPFDSIKEIPLPVKTQLQSSREAIWEYMNVWVDSLDYGFGISDIGQGQRIPGHAADGLAAQLVASGDRDIRAAVHLLTYERRPSSKAVEVSRMATELYLKAYLATHGQFDESSLRKFSHDLVRLTEQCRTLRPAMELDHIAARVRVFPDIGARYQGETYEPPLLWGAYGIALLTATTYIRSVSDRDGRPQMFRLFKPS